MDNKPAYAELEKRVHELEQTNTACQQLLAELRQSEDRFRRLWEQSPSGYQSLDAQGRFVEVNQSWIDILGYAREEVIGRSFADFLHPDWREHFKTNFPRFKAVGEILGVEFEMVKKDGSLITVSFNGKISRNDDGQFRQTHCVLQDITARKQAEVAISQNQQTFSELIERAPFGIYVVDSGFRIAHMNINSQKGAFRNVRPVIGRDFAEAVYILWPEPVAAEVIGHFRHTLETGEPYYSPRFINPRADVGINESYEWELHRMTLPDGQFGAICYFFDSTKLREAEVALQASEQQLRLAQTAANLGIYDVDVPSGKIKLNARVRELWGVGPDESITYDRFKAWLHPTDLAATQAAVDRALDPAGAGSYNAEYRIINPVDGATRWVAATGIVTFEQSRAVRLVGTVQDITERKQAEQALRRSEERWNAAIENFGEGAIIATETEQVIYWNPAARAMHGFASDREGIGPLEKASDTFELWTPDGTRPLTIDEWPMRRIKRGETVRKMELRLRRLDQGWERIVAYSGAMVCTPSGEGLIFLSVNDLTEQRDAQMALRSSEDRFRSVVENLSEGLMLFDEKGIIYQNAASLKIHGFKGPQDMRIDHKDLPTTWKGWDETGRPLSFEEWPLARVLRHESFQDQVLRAVSTETGKEFWACYNGLPFLGTDGRLMLGFITIRDITEARRTQNALKESQQQLLLINATLEKQISERTQLAESRTKQLQALAVELIETEERERRKFSDLLHDDLQQMLAAAKMQVQAVAEILSSEPMLSDAVQLLDESIAKSRRLSHQLSPAILHQTGLITALGWLSRQVKEQFGLHVELDIETELLMERTPQKVFLFRAVQELLFNTVKHAGVKSARVVVTSSEDSITVTVSDQGRGFDPQSLEKRTGNLGLGLLTIKERAGYVGGKFSIESAPGQCSRFTLTVPNAAANEEERALGALIVEEPNHSRRDATISGAGGIRVLFVDDHRVMRQGLMNLVKGQPAIHVAGEASNGREAIEQAHKLLPDVIMMDISMPEMDGIEATRRIKEELPNIRVIGLTMHDDEQISASMNQAGAEVTLSKTLSAAEVVKAIYGAVK